MQDYNWLSKTEEECCGCGACASICPCNAVVLKSDKEGFFYPHISEDKCVGCNLCIKVCAFKQKDRNDSESTIKQQYAIKYKRQDLRKNSQAGGSFAALAVSLFERYKNVAVYGAAFYEVYKVAHTRIKSADDLEKLQGSKYIQSELQGVYFSVEEDLNNGYTVMFAGTPCQVHAVKKYLDVKKINQTNLYLMDFICEGVGSPYTWYEYMKLIERRYKGKIKKVIFRDKRLGWINHYETIQLENKKYTIASRRWTNLFYDKLFFRKSCHNCKYTSLNRESDITVSWFGNVKKYYPDFYDSDGVSGIMVNSVKGENWMNWTKLDMEYIPVTMQDLMQKQLAHPIEVSPQREAFWKDFDKMGVWKTMKKYDTATYKNKIKRKVKNLMQSEWKWF